MGSAKARLGEHLDTISQVLKDWIGNLPGEASEGSRAYQALLLIEKMRAVPLEMRVSPFDPSVLVSAGPFGDFTHTSVINKNKAGDYVAPVTFLEALAHLAADVEADSLNNGGR